MDFDNLKDLEKELGLPPNSLNNIPIYARMPAVKAIRRVLEMEKKSLFRPGIYYIVLADLVGNTKFNLKYGNGHADTRVEWFHTAAIQATGEFELSNYVTFNKTIGDASLLIFSSIKDVIIWSKRFTEILSGLDQEYESVVYEQSLPYPIAEDTRDQQVEDFKLKARRLVHVGEVSYANNSDPLSLAVSQTFKIEKEFSEVKLGCTENVAQIIRPVIKDLGYKLEENKRISIAGEDHESMSYYIVPY